MRGKDEMTGLKISLSFAPNTVTKPPKLDEARPFFDNDPKTRLDLEKGRRQTLFYTITHGQKIGSQTLHGGGGLKT